MAFCNKCGIEVAKDDRFCPECGGFITKGVRGYSLNWPKTSIEGKSPFLALVLTIALPFVGGFWYIGQYGRGFKYLILSMLAGVATLGIGAVIGLLMAMYHSYNTVRLINSGKIKIVDGQMVYSKAVNK